MAVNSTQNSNPYPKIDADKLRETNASKLSDRAVQYHDDCLKQLDNRMNRQHDLPREK